VATGLAGAIGITAFMFGAGVPGAVPHLADIGAWLSANRKGMVVHANGLAGRIDGRVRLTNSLGHPLKVVQDGSTVLVADEVTGVISRIDPAQLTVADSRDYGAAGVAMVAGSGQLYVIDPAGGTVQRVNPVTLATIGSAVTLTGPLGQGGIDSHGTLWVPEPATGQLVPVRDGARGAPVKVGNPGDPLSLTIAAGTPVVADSARGVAMTVASTGAQLGVTLPSAMTSAGPAGVLAPQTADGQVVPLLSGRGGALVLVDIGTGALTTVPVRADGDSLGPPQILGRTVYIPDQTRGSLIVYDAARAQFDPQIPVTGHATALDAFVKDGMLWVNDEGSGSAVSIEASGAVHRIGKYADGVPGGRASKEPGVTPASYTPGSAPASNTPGATPASNTPGATPASNTPGATPGGGAPASASPVASGRPRPSAAGTPAAQPGPPGTVTATSGPGFIDVTFTPSGSGTPAGYALRGAPAGTTVVPARVPPGGPFMFRVSGGSCSQQYSFQVAALWPGPDVLSALSVPARPCTPPAAPQNFQVTGVNHGADLQWVAPVTAAAQPVTYSLSWNGGTQGGITGTSASVTGLTNGQQYTFTLTAANVAGTGQAAATATLTLTPPPQAYQIWNNADSFMYVDSAPYPAGTNGSTAVGTVPAGQTPTVTVQCQVRGGTATDPFDLTSDDIWDQVNWNGQTAYISDMYVNTANSLARNYGTFTDPPLWECT
jgi:hypothetical protein